MRLSATFVWFVSNVPPNSIGSSNKNSGSEPGTIERSWFTLLKSVTVYLSGDVKEKLSSPSSRLVKSKMRFHLLTFFYTLPSSSVNSPNMSAAKECSWRRGYLKLKGANVRLEELSTIGSLGVYTLTKLLVSSLQRNCEQQTVTSHESQFRMKSEDLTGPMKNFVFLQRST